MVVIDDGLSVDDWVKLESGYYGIRVDIVKYLVPDRNGEVAEIGSEGVDNFYLFKLGNDY